MRRHCLTQRSSAAARQRGFTIIENLVAISLVAISLVGASRLIITTMHGNAAARTYSSLVGEVQAKIDGYRQQSFAALLSNIGSSPSAITHGQSATVSSSSKSARASFVTTFTAVKSGTSGIPQAIRIKVVATQRQGHFGQSAYSFETLIANVS